MRRRATTHPRYLILLFVAVSFLLSAAIIEARAHHMDESQIDEAIQSESAAYFPLTHFYDILPEHIPGDPGTLIRSQEFHDYNLGIEGTRAIRILYRSRDAHGEPSVSSGYVLIPPGESPDGGWPLLAYAHGTTGVARNCAPSLRENRYDGNYLDGFIDAGYAVVATDYAGLGTDSAHQFLAYDAQANDLIYSVPAAQEAASAFGVSNDWVSIGHSQGGGTVIRAAEILRHPNHADTGYLGGVALAPGVRVQQLFEHLVDHSAHGFHVMLHHGVKNTYPNFELSSVMQPDALGHAHVAQNGCNFSVINVTYGLIPQGELLTDDWASVKYMRKFLRENTVGTKRMEGPVLVTHGTADHLVPIDLVDAAFEDMCKTKSTVMYLTYEGAGHGVQGPSAEDVRQWIGERFDGLTAPSNC